MITVEFHFFKINGNYDVVEFTTLCDSDRLIAFGKHYMECNPEYVECCFHAFGSNYRVKSPALKEF